MHSILEQRKQWQKQYISIRKTDLFYNSMRLCGNFTTIASIWFQKYVPVFVHSHFILLKLEENCELCGTDCVQKQTYEHIFMPDGGLCVYHSSILIAAHGTKCLQPFYWRETHWQLRASLVTAKLFDGS